MKRRRLTATVVSRALAGMGPVEWELRNMNPERFTLRALSVVAGARLSLLKQGAVWPARDDVMSEAIEAAAALGL